MLNMKLFIKFIMRKMLVIFSCCIAFTTVMALLPSQEIPEAFNFWDKAQHSLAFITLSITGSYTFPNNRKAVYIGLILYGATIEIMQLVFTTTRVGEVSDLVTDAIGILIGFIVFTIINKSLNHQITK
jgi:VanZ family protein